ncbi:DEAD/DEAH box helicase domain-containing protein [Bifidobacterium actinocoloniiforme DSM 22766]|uniref:DEAD/DEAH box helicase domain-containing protein n=2 Tax=Bifidobacterium actinocoloniiforme TaxID=638619 RepID=A0A086YYC9_9BIFI|nr:DEAD/DEAH box helicase domain-containing protein [Bifidobacterium actinocoloniiforme DSM 22766]
MSTLAVNEMTAADQTEVADSTEAHEMAASSMNAETVDPSAGAADEAPKTFAELGVPEPLVRVLKADGKTTAFPIQEDTLPDSLAGRDILGRGRTGSGKTLAFVLPLVARLAASQPDRRRVRDIRSKPAPRGLILSPTRELANQTDEVLAPLARVYGLDTCTVYGGVRQNKQVNALRSGAEIVVACPGRLEDLLRQGMLTLDDVEITILDEADEMSDMGFLPAVERILDQVRDDGQRMLFSATLDHGVDKVVKRYLHNAKVHEVDSATQQVEQMTQHVFETTQGDKHELVRKLASGKGKRILFTRTKFQAKKLAANLTKAGIPAAELHGNLSQNQRDRNLDAFSDGQVRVLVATDVAARGVDVSDVKLVVQVDPPADPKSFLHRSGRTARAGKAGDVVTIVLPNQRRDARRMLKIAHIDAKPVTHVTAESDVVDELVGETAPRVDGWVLKAPAPARGKGSGRGGRGDGGRRDGRRGGARDGGRKRDFRKEGKRSHRTRDSYDSHGSRGSQGARGFGDEGPFDGRRSQGGDHGYRGRSEDGGQAQGRSRNPRYGSRNESRRGRDGGNGGQRSARGFQHRSNRSKRANSPFRGR